MKPTFTAILLLTTLVCSSQEKQSYVSFYQDTLDLWAWNGEKTMLLSESKHLDTNVMKLWLRAMDSTYNYYQMCNDRTPHYYTDVTYINGLSTIAEVANTCGAGCAYVSWTGIELQTVYFNKAYDLIRTSNQYDQVVFYEFGRNFYLISDELTYKNDDPVVTGYAIFMRFASMDYIGVDGASFDSMTFTQFKNAIRNLLNIYMRNQNLNWHNTLGAGNGVPNNFGASDLFASFCMYLQENYGGHKWVMNVWKQAALRPIAVTTQDAVDNFIIASSIAAEENLSALFEHWRWPVSEPAKEELLTKLGKPNSVTSTNVSLNVYPNPAKDKLYFSSPFEKVQMYNINGELICTQITNEALNIEHLPSGFYILKITSSSRNVITRKILKI